MEQTQTGNNVEIKERPGWGERISYGACGTGVRLVSAGIGSYLLVYYTNVAMLEIAVISIIIAVSRFFDGVSDVIIGHVVDNTRSKLGKAKIWLLRMCLPFALSTLLLFWVPPRWPDAVKYIYVFLMYNLVNSVFFTFMQIGHMSLISLMSDDEEEHGLLGNIHALSRSIGLLVSGSFFVKLLELFTSEPGNPNTQRGYTCTIIIMGIAMVLLTLVTVLFTRERAYENTSKADGSKTDPTKMMEVLGILLKDKYWRVILICELLLFIALQMPMAGIAYFAMYVLNDMNATSWLMFLTVSSGVIMQFMVPVLIQRVGKHRLCIIGLASAIVAYTVFGLMIPDTALMKPCLIVYGAGKGLFEGMLFGIVADIISYTKDKTGQFIAGVGNAGTSAVNKIGMGIGSILFGFALSTAGFDAALDTQGIAQPAAVVTTTTFMFVWFPIILYSITLVIYVLFFDMYRNQKCA